MNNKYGYGYGYDDNSQEVSSSPIDALLYVLRIAKRRKLIITAILLLGIAVTVYKVYHIVPSYSAETVIKVNTSKPTNIPGGRGYNNHHWRDLNLNSEIEVIRSLPLLKRVVTELGLFEKVVEEEQVDPSFFDVILNYLKRADLKVEASNENKVEPKEYDQSEIIEHIAEIIQRNLEVVTVNRTLLIKITYTDIDQYRTQKIVNAIAETYLKQHVENRLNATDRATTWLSQRLSKLQSKLRESKRRVHEFKEENGLLKSDGETLSDKQFKALNEELIEARTSRTKLELEYKRLSQIIDSDGGFKKLVEVVQSDSLSRLRQEYTRAEKTQAELVTRFNNKHPKVISINAEIRDLDRQIKIEGKRILEKVKSDFDFAKVRVKSIEKELNSNTEKTSLSKKAALQLSELEQEVTVNEAIYQDFLTRFKKASEQKTLKLSDFIIVSKAVLPKRHDGNKKRLKIGVLHLAGTFAIAFGVVFLLEFRDKSFRTRLDAENSLGIPYITSVPLLTQDNLVHGNKLLKIKDVVIEKSVSSFSQSLSTLLFKMKKLSAQKKANVILLTSAIPNEGKTLLVSSIARHLANNGKRVLAIDCDMRKASLSANFYSDFPEYCLGDVLQGKINWKDVLVLDEKTNLEVLPSILGDYEYLELLDSQIMKDIIEEAKGLYDHIIIDTPPVKAVPDVHALSDHVDAIGLVVEWGVTPRQVVIEANKLLGQETETPRGFILNKVDLKNISDYEDYSSYGYGYGYGYGQA